jgi:large subunit ribosomal protein L7/L12
VAEVAKVVEEKPKEEEKKEKTHYDIELSKFDAAKKVGLIKVVRQILGLGLQESKALVEGAPVWFKKEVAKEEAEKLK